MSIIRDALKKTGDNHGRDISRHNDIPKTGRTNSLVTNLLMGCAVVIGLVLVVVMGQRGYEMYEILKMKKDRAEIHSSPSNVTGTVTVETGSRVVDPQNSPSEYEEEENMSQAERFFWLGDLSGAEKILRRSITLGVGDPAELANNLGLIVGKKGKLSEALSLLDQAIRYEPDMVEALSNRAVVYRKLGRLMEAEVDLRKALVLNPGFADAQFNLATVYEALGQTETAIQYYRMYIDNRARKPALAQGLILQRISALESRISKVSLSSRRNVKER